MKRDLALLLCAAAGIAQAATAQTVRYVDAGAKGKNDGTSWANAYTDLQKALATPSGELWVAAGTYKPAPPTGSRNVTFQLRSGLALYGGFAGSETKREQRDPASRVTILSGDLKGNDGTGATGYAENSRHVVTGSGVAATAILDGFTIRSGNATILGTPHFYGGGLFVYGSGSPTVRNCRFTKNRAAGGGGGVNYGGSPSFEHCVFDANDADFAGGFYSISGTTIFTDCVFDANKADHKGGGLGNKYSNTILTRCIFRGNSALEYGAGLWSDGRGALTTMTDCAFTGNRAGKIGGGAFLYFVSATATRCTFSENTATLSCGGLYGIGSVRVESSILWHNGGVTKNDNLTGVAGTAKRSCVQGLTVATGSGNLNVDPLFVNAKGPDGVAGTKDDDLRLRAKSPCIDLGNAAAMPMGLDLGGMPRILDGKLDGRLVVDMGAHEFANARLALGVIGTGATRVVKSAVTGTTGLPVLALLGGRSKGVVVAPFGALFIDLALPIVTLGVGLIPVARSDAVPVGVTLDAEVQVLALGVKGANFSNPARLRLR